MPAKSKWHENEEFYEFVELIVLIYLYTLNRRTDFSKGMREVYPKICTSSLKQNRGACWL